MRLTGIVGPMRLYLLSVQALEGQSPITTRLRWRLPDGTVLTEDVSDAELNEMTEVPGCPWDCEHRADQRCQIHLVPGSHYKTRVDYA